MYSSPLPTAVIAAAERSSDRLAHDLAAELGPNSGMAARGDVERFVADCMAWARRPETVDVGRLPPLIEPALRLTARWGDRDGYEAAAWQLLLSALAMAGRDEAGRRAVG